MNELEKKLREICTYHSDGGTNGYNLSEEQFGKLKALFTSEWERMVKESKPDKFYDCSDDGVDDAVMMVDQYESNLTQKLAKLMEEEE